MIFLEGSFAFLLALTASGSSCENLLWQLQKYKKVITELLQQTATLDARFLTKICIKWSQKGAAIPMTVAGNLTVYSSPNYNSSLCYLTRHCHVIWTSSPFQVTCQNYPLTGSLLFFYLTPYGWDTWLLFVACPRSSIYWIFKRMKRICLLWLYLV